MLAENESERVTLSAPNRKLSCGVEARKTVLPCRHLQLLLLLAQNAMKTI